MNILVTGGRGQLGCSLRAICDEYSQHKFVFTDMPELDITDREAVGRFVGEHAIDVIVNCAAYTAVDRAESDVELAERINILGPEILAEVAVERGSALIHISTDYVFSGQSCHPLRETDATAPTGVYGDTKLRGERAIADSGCRAAVIRTAWLYSAFGANFVKTMLRVGAAAIEKFRDNQPTTDGCGQSCAAVNVVYDQIGTPTYAPDLARAIMCVVEHGVDGFELYHFSNEGVCSWYDFAKEIFALTEMQVEVRAIESGDYPTPARRPAYSVLAKDKIKALGAVVPYWHDSLVACIGELSAQR